MVRMGGVDMQLIRAEGWMLDRERDVACLNKLDAGTEVAARDPQV